jgi:hypothetical protein
MSHWEICSSGKLGLDNLIILIRLLVQGWEGVFFFCKAAVLHISIPFVHLYLDSVAIHLVMRIVLAIAFDILVVSKFHLHFEVRVLF